MNQTTIGPARVKLQGGSYAKNAKIDAAKITRLGSTPNATIKIFKPTETESGGVNFVEFDRLTQAEYRANDRDESRWTVSGISDQYLADVAGSTPDDPDARVTWEVQIVGCDNCG